jgi:LEA14-like dessication related protein
MRNLLERSRSAAGLLVALIALTGCATMGSDYEEPTVSLTSFRALPSDSISPEFEVGLRILNPNPQDLELVGIVYTISLEGQELIKGVGKDFPVIEGYSQEDVTLTAGVQLLSGIRLITGLMQANSETLNYEFNAKLDLAGMYPSIRVSEGGEFNFGASPR